MAEPGNGRLELKVGGNAFGITSRDLISVLLILVSGLGGYFVATQLTTNQRQGIVGLSTIAEKMTANQLAWMETVGKFQGTLIELVHTNRQEMEESMRAQNTFIHQQTLLLTEKVEKQNEQFTSKFDKVALALTVLNYNLHREIGEQLPS